jgi:hypothetical protein
LDWSQQEPAYVGVFDRLTGAQPRAASAGQWPELERRTAPIGTPRVGDRRVIDLRDLDEVRAFAYTRAEPASAQAPCSDEPVMIKE